jgi:glutathione synthase
MLNFVYLRYLEDFCYKIEYISTDLKSGKSINIKNEDVLKLLGELFSMRNFVNLQSNFLDTPDFYWDRENLEFLYSQLYSHFLISKRTKLFNDRLNHCIDLMNLLKQHLTDNKHTRLEWIIIWLITIEVLIAFGLLDMVKYLVVYLFNLIK